MKKKIVGILGGMGPAATADLFRKIIDCTPAESDREHLHVIIDSNTDIPDRTDALLHGGESPVPQLRLSAKRLETAGAELIVMPCNTAHCFYDEVASAVSVPVLHMIKLTASFLGREGVARAGLLATEGTVKTGVYERCFSGSGIELIAPDADAQTAVTELIYDGVKAGRRDFDTSRFEDAARSLLDRGAQTLILGCTELPCAVSMCSLKLPCTDPTLILAQAAVAAAVDKT